MSRPCAPEQVRFNVDELEMRDLLCQIQLDVPIAPKPIDAKRKTESAPEYATYIGWALAEVVWQSDESRPITLAESTTQYIHWMQFHRQALLARA